LQFSFLCPVCVMLRLLHELRAAQRAVCKHQRWFSAAAAGNNDFLRKYSSATPSGSRKFLLLTPELAESTASCIAETFSNKDEAFTWALNLKRHHWHSLTIPFIERAANGGCSIMPRWWPCPKEPRHLSGNHAHAMNCRPSLCTYSLPPFPSPSLSGPCQPPSLSL